MKRIGNLIISDIRFQYKYGIYLLYAIFTLIYIGILGVLPSAWKEQGIILILFSDPATLGFFFSGVILLFEKSERVLNSLAVSPVTTPEYVFSKSISLSTISTLCGCIIAAVIQPDILSGTFIPGLLLGSIFFTLSGLIISGFASSLNQFILLAIPLEIIILLPAIAEKFGFTFPFAHYHPGIITMRLLSNANEYSYFIILGCWIILFYGIAIFKLKKVIKSSETVRL